MLSLLTLVSLNLRGQTFRNYKLSLGTGVQFDPVFFLSNKTYSNGLLESIKPALSAEMQFLPAVSFGLSYSLQFQNFDMKVNPEFPNFRYAEGTGFHSKVNTTVSAIDFHTRIYSLSSGYMAPWGRYLDYGFSMAKYKYEIENTMFTVIDANGSPVDVYYDGKNFSSGAYYGIRLGYGKKTYFDKGKNTFLDLSINYRIMFDVVGNNYNDFGGNVGALLRTAAIKKFQNTSIFNISAIYGFSI